jgi:predicted nucleotidyltransferase component of viral defense system
MSDQEVQPKKKQGERNPAASLQQKLRNVARATGDDVALVLARYVNERFLYRLSVSPYRERFILRGATLFTIWDAELHRATRDIDLLATGDSSPEALRQILEAICQQSVEEDGVVFQPETLNIEERVEGRISRNLTLNLAILNIWQTYVKLESILATESVPC